MLLTRLEPRGWYTLCEALSFHRVENEPKPYDIAEIFEFRNRRNNSWKRYRISFTHDEIVRLEHFLDRRLDEAIIPRNRLQTVTFRIAKRKTANEFQAGVILDEMRINYEREHPGKELELMKFDLFYVVGASAEYRAQYRIIDKGVADYEDFPCKSND